jgi:hypothetical protein
MYKPVYDEQGYIIGFQEVADEVIEYRLYYDDHGRVVTYTMDKMEGDYVVIDKQTFAEARPDIRVINGRITTVNPNFIVCKLMPHDYEGTLCAYEDISILVDEDVEAKSQRWKINTYELQ